MWKTIRFARALHHVSLRLCKQKWYLCSCHSAAAIIKAARQHHVDHSKEQLIDSATDNAKLLVEMIKRCEADKTFYTAKLADPSTNYHGECQELWLSLYDSWLTVCPITGCMRCRFCTKFSYRLRKQWCSDHHGSHPAESELASSPSGQLVVGLPPTSDNKAKMVNLVRLVRSCIKENLAVRKMKPLSDTCKEMGADLPDRCCGPYGFYEVADLEEKTIPLECRKRG